MTSPQNPFDPPTASSAPALPAWPQAAASSGYYQPLAPPQPYALVGQPAPTALLPTTNIALGNLAAPKVRLLAWAINLVLIVVTLGIGYLVWTLILWRSSTNPGKQMLGLRVVHADTEVDATWGHLAIRSALMPLTLGWFPYLGQVLLVADGLFVFGPRNQRLIDRWARTLVVTA